MDFFARIFDTSDFPPRWHCGNWTPLHGWLHILSDLGVWSAYVAIPCVLGYFVLRRRDIPFRRIFWLFGAFILACGTTHLMEAIIFWWPAYRLAGGIKLVTAIVSWCTVIALVPIVPVVLSMRSPEALEREVAARKVAEVALAHANAELERRVEQRTAELAEVNVALRASEARHRESDQRKSEFLATLAHELRNPLAPIRNALHVMRLTPDGPASERSLQIMERQLGQLIRLVDDLLDTSRISRGKLALRKARVPLAAIIENAVETAHPLIDAKGHTLTIDIPGKPVFLDADLTRMAQVVWNLLSNSAKYTDPGGRIQLSARCEGSDVLLSVRDNGIGVRREEFPRLFTMFSQLDHSLERAEGGLGIGLALVKGIVEMHGGTVQVLSDGLKRGTEFIIRVPAAEPVPIEAPANPPPPMSDDSRRVLVVDDNRDSAASLAALLSLSGHDTRTAHDGLEALELAEAFLPAVILLDLGLPKLNGYDVARRIRNLPWAQHILLVAVTGWGQDSDKLRSAEAGFDAHLTKPIDFDQLLALLGDSVTESTPPPQNPTAPPTSSPPSA